MGFDLTKGSPVLCVCVCVCLGSQQSIPPVQDELRDLAFVNLNRFVFAAGSRQLKFANVVLEYYTR